MVAASRLVGRRRGQLHTLLRVGFRTCAILGLVVAFATLPPWVTGRQPLAPRRRLSSDDKNRTFDCYNMTARKLDTYCEYSNYGSFPGTSFETVDRGLVAVTTTTNATVQQCAIKDCLVDGEEWLCHYKAIDNPSGDGDAEVNLDSGGTQKIYTTVAYTAPISPFTAGGLICYIIGLLYMFLGLAIVCDEFFVPALEEIVDRTGMTEDVAGATLMAAGGSAPELFTSFLGTFVTKSSVGFGTIVGSAVFNVLFVIGMCAIFAKDELTLTWWPLFRDSTYYFFSLCMVAVFFSVITPGEIYWWEALALFSLYGLYVVIMKFNKDLHRWVSNLIGENKPNKIVPTDGQPLVDADGSERTDVRPMNPGEPSVSAEPTEMDQGVVADNVPEPVRSGSGVFERGSKMVQALAIEHHMNEEDHKSGSGHRRVMMKARQATIRSFHRQDEAPQFRAGLLHFMKTARFAVDNLRVHVVSELPGDVKETFDKIDTDHDGEISKGEMAVLLHDLLGRNPEQKEVIKAIRDIGPDGPEVVTFDEFKQWYAVSEVRLEQKMLDTFKSLDDNNDDHVDKTEVSVLLARLTGEEPSLQLIQSAMKEFDKDDDGFITLDEFRTWYKHSMLYQSKLAAQKALEEDMEDEEGLDPWPPTDKGARAMILWALTLPIVLPLWITVPDVRKDNLKCLFPLTWTLSICWIGFYSYFMVWWATLIGDRFGIPPVVMGLTFLAAGTSIPDLLTSVIVARQGLGDMAVSSSIGSNIFDVLIGLPIPWLIHGLAIGPFKVGAEGLGVSIAVLIIMLGVLVGSIHFSGWKMSKLLGYIMFAFYGVFVAQDLVRQKIDGCL